MPARAGHSGRQYRAPPEPPAATAGQAHRDGRPAVEISQFHHEPLGVERPALGMAAHQRPDTPPPVEYVAAVQSLGDLQMMARDAFVVDGRAFLPRREPGLAPRHRPPHATGTRGQVCSRLRVVDAALFGRSDQAFQATDRRGNVEVPIRERIDRRVGRRLHPIAERVGTTQCVLGRRVEIGECPLDRRAAPDLLCGGAHVVHDAGEFSLSPIVGLVQVDPRAQKSARVQRVQVPADGIARRRPRHELVAQEGSEFVIGGRGRRTVGRQVGGQRVRQRPGVCPGSGRQRAEKPSGRP